MTTTKAKNSTKATAPKAAKPAATRPTAEKVVHHRRFTGTVVKVSAAKTIAVEVNRVVTDPKYRKQYKRTTKYLVHDEGNTAKVGDEVVFVECRPISKQKRWRLVSTKA